ncbi:Adapter molecule Crk [Armadillidium nasatum]|uniref:Adapter molecule Crk n=1 Tax=Armadillidium nasatum TaxID=96803 RepID=A0A5N5SJ06_9CRUS|nr:Adapter molecule Crk [Armadillidium nasatum]
MSRQEATDLLMSEREGGVFLVRDSTTIFGDFVLCVREDNKVSHYIINKIQQNDQQIRYRIGDQMFPDLPSLLNFYKLHYLDTTPLIRPVTKRCEKVIAKYDFEGHSGNHKILTTCPLKKGKFFTIVTKDEDQWWTARNSNNQTGSIPVPYVVKFEFDLIFHYAQDERKISLYLTLNVRLKCSDFVISTWNLLFYLFIFSFSKMKLLTNYEEGDTVPLNSSTTKSANTVNQNENQSRPKSSLQLSSIDVIKGASLKPLFRCFPSIFGKMPLAILMLEKYENLIKDINHSIPLFWYLHYEN